MFTKESESKMLSFKTLAKDLVAYGLMSGISKGINFILLPVFTRQFTTAEYGIIDIIVIFISLIALLIRLSLENAVMRFWFEAVKEKKQHILVSTALLFIFISGTVIIFVIYLFSGSISGLLFKNMAAETGKYIVAGSFAALFMALNTVPLIALRMRRRIFSYNVVNILQSILYVGLALLLIFTNDKNLIEVFIALAVSHLAALIIGLALNKKYLTSNISWNFLKPSLKYSLPMFPGVFTTWVNKQADRILILTFLSLSAVGVFAASARIVAMIALVLTVFKQAWNPLAIEAINKDKNERNAFYKKMFNIYFIVMFSLAVVVLLFTKPLLEMLVPEEYQTGYIIVPWLLGARILYGSSNITNLGSVVSKKTAINSIAAWSGTIINISIGLLLIPAYGIAGAAIGSFIAGLVFTIILWKKTTALEDIEFNKVLFVLVLIGYICFSIGFLIYY